MKEKFFKKSNGITLIALVVTIVVLLILAGISISMVLGNNGLITKAKEAKTQTEQDALNTDKAINSLVDEIDAILGDSSSDVTVDISSLAIGDYINYTYDTVADGYSLLGSQSGYTDYDEDGNSVGKDQTITQNPTTLKWRILNIDETNRTIDLVSENPSDGYVYFQGALGYNNGVYLLNDICATLYSNSSLGVTARSINLADMEKHLTETGFAARNAYTSSVQYGTTPQPYTVDTSYYPSLYANQLGAGINLAEGATVTQPDIDGTVDPYNESDSYYSTPTTDTYSQASDTGLTVTQTYYDISINEDNYGEAAAILDNGDYWIASRCTEAYSDEAYFGLRFTGFLSEVFYFYSSYGQSDEYVFYSLRPVVSLSASLLDGTQDSDGAWNLK